MKEQWRQQMQEKLADYKKPAPEVSWDEIDKALASNRQKATDRRVLPGSETKVVPMWIRRIAAAVVALVAVTAGYLAFHHEETPVDNKVEAVNSKPMQTPVEPKADESQQVNEAPAKLMANNTTPRLLVQNHEPVLEIQEDAPSVNTLESITQEEQTIQETEESSVEETHETQKVLESSKRQTLDEPYEIRKSKASENRLMAKVYLSNGLSGDMSDNSSYKANTNYYSKEEYADGHKNEYEFYYSNKASLSDNLINKYLSNSILQQKTVVYEEEVHHRLPVRIGLSLRYRLNDKWSLESGLAYTRLRSDFVQRINDISVNANNVRVNTEQTLSYIGIPLAANYLLKSSRYVNFYVSAGGMVEKMVKGRQQCKFEALNLESTESVSIGPLQFSVNSGFGAEFNLSPLFSIYAEPGVAYYFDNGSSIPTYYQDKPFSFNLNLGLRFNIK